jgi:SAM-dependent methyltransferase
MAGQGIPLLRTMRNALQMYNKHRKHTDREVEIYHQRYEFLVALLKKATGKPVSEARVLEVGCGQRAVVPLLFAANGAEVCAVDVEPPTYRMSVLSFFRTLRNNGAHRAIKSAVRHVLFDRRFFAGLEQACGVALRPFPTIDIRVTDAAQTELPRDRFDMIFSFNVMEHIVNVESAVRNINSALKPGGVGYVTVHLFPSLSGGHCMDWQHALDSSYPDCGIPSDVPPWDHLRENLYPPDSFLNRLRLRDYREVFQRCTLVVAEDLQREGEDLLQLAPSELLTAYTAEDLTTALAAFTFRKSPAAPAPAG